MPAVSVQISQSPTKGTEAVRDVAFEVNEGEVFVPLGPNGAGKTTIIEILEGFRKRDHGHVVVLGYDPADAATGRQLRERMGVVLQELAVEPFLSVRQALTRNAGYYPNPRSVDEVLGLVGLAGKADDRVKSLSGGQQRRLDLGLGIVGNPSLLFLDEPTTGFDPSARRGAWEVVRALTGGGTTVVLTTHYMDEAEALADRVAVLNAGRIVAEGAPESLGGRDVGESTIRFRLPAGAASTLPVPAKVLNNGVYEVKTDREIEVLGALTSWALRENVDVVGLSVERLTLEDVYLRLTGFQSDTEDSSTRPGTRDGGSEYFASLSRGSGDLKLAGRQVYYEQLNFWLNPIGAVFTVGFSVVFLVLVGSTAGHQRSSAIGGGLLIGYYVPGFIAYGVMAACFNMLTINLVVRREMGLLKRVRLSPLPTWAMMAAVSANALIISAVQVVLVLLIGRFGYNVPFPQDLPALVVVLVVGAASFTALGLGVSTLFPNQEAGAPVTSIVFFVLLFLSGPWFPLAANSGLAKFSSYLPVRHMIVAVYDASIAARE